MSRRHQENNSFGSDSFLDVIANIVGILIILIVVAGVRVSRAPLLSLQQPEESITETVPVTIELLPVLSEPGDEPVLVELYTDPTDLEPIEPELIVEDFVAPEEKPLPEIKTATKPVALMQKAQSQQEQLDALLGELATLDVILRDLKQQETEQTGLASLKQGNLEAEEAKLLAHKQLNELTKEENERSEQVVLQLKDQLAQVSELTPRTEKLAHRLNPVGRLVNGNEVHFQLLDNRIAFVPIQALSELVKDDMKRRKDFLFKQRRFQSRVGPVNGFSMEYLVQRQSSGLLSDSSTGMIRISLTDWVLRPSSQVVAESFEEAITPGSRFREALVSEGSNATVTFWVYPDSFDIHGKLKQLVHDSGFWVASRPLPMNYPIAGSSTNGSKSIAQ